MYNIYICLSIYKAQSVGAEEYTDCISAEGKIPPNKSSGYIKPSDGEAPVMIEL